MNGKEKGLGGLEGFRVRKSGESESLGGSAGTDFFEGLGVPIDNKVG